MNRVKDILTELSELAGVQAIILLDSSGFPLESFYRTEIDGEELAGVARDALISNIRLANNFRKSAFIQGVLETSKSLMILTQFPKGIYMVTVAERNVGPQKLWNEVGRRYRQLAEALGE